MIRGNVIRRQNMQDIASLQQSVRNAVRNLYQESTFFELYKNNLHESVFSHRIAVYLEQEFPQHEYNVDCEYSKDLAHSGDKKRDDNGKAIRPDIIVHKRGGNREDNLILLEVKKCGHNTKKAKSDIEKIKSSRHLEYTLEVFIGILKKEATIVWVNLVDAKPEKVPQQHNL